MSLLTLVRDAAAELNVTVPAAVYASQDPQVQILLRHANAEGKALAKKHAWQAITTEQTFTTVAAAAQTNSIPSDFDRLVPETMFNRTSRRLVWGPVASDEWQRIQASLVTMVNPGYRIQANTIYLTPTPSAGETVAYEYVSTKWCQSSGGTAQAAWAADTDTSKLDEEAMTLGIIYRFKKAKGHEYADEEQTYNRRVSELMLNDGSRARLRTDYMVRDRVPVAPQVPETLVF